MPIRKATLDDLDLLTNLFEISNLEDKNGLATDVYEIKKNISEGAIYLYHKEGNEYPLGVMIALDLQNLLNLHTMYVLPDHRSEGIGSEFLKKLTEILDTSCTDAFLKVRAHNPAIRLYERFGFREDNKYETSTSIIAMTRCSRPEDLSL